MTVTNVSQDPEALTLTMTAEFDATIEQAWKLWADPRKLERWWGPPEWPATFTDHDFKTGGKARYYMSGPDREKASGWWKFTKVEASNLIELVDGFADDDGNPNDEMPTTEMKATLAESTPGRTTMIMFSQFNSTEQMEQLAEMGMVEGMRAAMSQMDAILAEASS